MTTDSETVPLSIALRAYAEGTGKPRDWQSNDIGVSEDWVLVFDTETTVDHAQTLRFGFYHIYYKDALYKQGLFYNPDTITNIERNALASYTDKNGFDFLTHQEFNDGIFLKLGHELGAMIVGLNLPFDISRIAIAHGNANGKMRGGFSFQLSPNPFKPWVHVKYLSRRASIIKFRKVGSPPGRSRRNREEKSHPRNGYFLDLGTLAAALTNRMFSLKSLADYLETEHRKLSTDDHGAPITPDYLKYAATDVLVTWECHIKLRERFLEHRLKQTNSYQVFSEAGLGKAYLKDMDIKPWRKAQHDFPPELIGIIMSGYFGGRSEVILRQKIIQTAYCDFMSMYPTVCTLMGLWRWTIAQGIDWQDTPAALSETQDFLQKICLVEMQKPETWKKLCVFVQVKPDDDLFPVRAQYDSLNEFTDDISAFQYTIGLNCLKHNEPLWFTLADCVVAKLLTGKTPKIIKAIQFSPQAPQKNLKPISILGKDEYLVDPYKHDFYKRVIELRTATKQKMKGAPEAERERLDIEQGSFKTLANATSYGIFLQLNVDDLARQKVITCYGYNGKGYEVAVASVEKPGEYYHPVIGAFITGAARLMLGLAEKLGRDAGLDWIFCDTDSMAYAKPDNVSEPDFQNRVKIIRDWFADLSPYERLPDGRKPEMFKLEDANFGLQSDGKVSKNLEPLYCLAISAKRYVLFNRDKQGNPIIRKASAHGLGHLLSPYDAIQDRPDLPLPVFPMEKLVEKIGVNLWQHDIWYQIILNTQSGTGFKNPAPYAVFDQPAVRKYAATTPELLRWFNSFNKGKEYKDQVKPFNFLLAYKSGRTPKPRVLLKDDLIPLKAKFVIDCPAVVAPFDKNLKRAVAKCFDRKTGRRVFPDELETYQADLMKYPLHPEMKFSKGGRNDKGLAERRHIRVTEIRNIGKEANRLEEQTELEANPDAQIDYGSSPDDEAWFYKQLEQAKKDYGLTSIAQTTGITERQLQRIIKKEETPHPKNRRKLTRAFSLLEIAEKKKNKEIAAFRLWAKQGRDKTSPKDLAQKLGTTVSNLGSMIEGRRNPSKNVMAKYQHIIDT